MQTPYELLGGEAGVRQLAIAFYNVMSERIEAKTIRDMHAENLEVIQGKLFKYLSGWMGGPALYLEEYGTICLSSPHAKYAIGVNERNQWLACMDQALEQVGASDQVKTMLKEPMYNMAEMMRNKD